MTQSTIKPTTISLMVASTLLTACSSNNNVTDTELQAYREKASALTAQLSLQEKLNILSGPGMDLKNYRGIDATNLAKGKDVLGVAGYINGAKNEQVDIPAIKLADGPAGLRINPDRDGDENRYFATSWPIGSLLASTWDKTLVEQVGHAEGNEVKEYGVDFLLAPGMNIQRNPLLGRNFEYYSEDPLLSGKTAAAMVRGIQSNGVGATIKHFVANNAETNRFFNNSVVDPRTLREIYLKSFEIAVKESQPWAVMTSYNLVNGQYANQRKDLLTDILRGEWGFDGLVMSDWFAGNVFGLKSDFRGRIERDPQSAAKQVIAGNDLIEPGGVKDDLASSYKNGMLTDEQIDRGVEHILTQVQKTPSYHGYKYSNRPDLDTHAQLARQAATEGMVLLKNDHAALPFVKGAKVATFGTTQINTLKGGTGSGDVNSAYISHIAPALSEQFTVNQALVGYYQDYFNSNKVKTAALIGGYDSSEEPNVSDEPILKGLIQQSALDDAAALIVIGRQAGEGGDRTPTRGDYLLTQAELATIKSVSSAFHAQGKPVCVVLNVNGVVDTTEWANDVDSILLAYMGGQETGHSIADIVSGAVNPSGKLAQTIPVHYSDVPSSSTFPGMDSDGNGEVDTSFYNEGVYVGYRYYTTFDKQVAFPFGYGLSYTNFNYGAPVITANTLNSGNPDAKITISLSVKNIGQAAGKEVAQVYIAAPDGVLEKPAIELKAFEKTGLLSPNASQDIDFDIDTKTLASFDAEHDRWIVEAGHYTAYVASSSDVKGQRFAAPAVSVDFDIAKTIVVGETTPHALALESDVKKADFVTINK